MPPNIDNVLIVTRELKGDRRYGIGRSLTPFVESLNSRGWRVRYLSQEDLPSRSLARRQDWLARIENFPGLSSKPMRRQLLAALFERIQMGWFAAATARDQHFSVVQLHDPWLAWGFMLRCKIYRLRGIRWGVTEHGFGCYSQATHEDGLAQGPFTQRVLRRLEAHVLQAAAWVTAPTQLALDQVARDLALPFTPSHWRAVPHAAPDIRRTDQAQARDALGWAPGDMHVLGVGRLAPLKRFDMLIRACATVARHHPAIQLHLLGDGDQTGLRQLADTLGFGARLHIALVDDVRPYYSAADVYVSTSTTESFGLANFEAMHAGIPCICTCVGGVPEVMGAGAWLIPCDQDVLTDALEELTNDVTIRQTMARRATEQARKACTPDEITDQYVALFHQSTD